MAKVSVIIAVLNGVKTIGKALESARRQTEADIEIIVVDDGSTDGTADYVKILAQNDPRIQVITLDKNSGGAAATNVGIEHSTGEWIAILDADDWFEPRRLEILLNAAKTHNADLVCDNLQIYDHAQGEVIEATRYGSPNTITHINAETYIQLDNPLQRYAIGYTKPMVKKKFLGDKKIAYRNDHRFGYDFIFFLEILLNGGRAILVPGAYYIYVHRISPTTRKQSPLSRSESGHSYILRGCNELLTKYDGKMNPAEHAALTRRRNIFRDRLYCEDMLILLRQKNIGGATLVVLGHPFILVLISVTIAKLVYANWLSARRSLQKLLT